MHADGPFEMAEPCNFQISDRFKEAHVRQADNKYGITSKAVQLQISAFGRAGGGAHFSSKPKRSLGRNEIKKVRILSRHGLSGVVVIQRLIYWRE